MRGRNGVDNLYYFLFSILCVLCFLNLFFQNFFLQILESIVLVLLLMRFFSKNISKRRKENAAYLKIQNRILKKCHLFLRKWKDRNTHIYKRCPSCKKMLRLPLKKGKNTAVCPKCGDRFSVRCYKNAKI